MPRKLPCDTERLWAHALSINYTDDDARVLHMSDQTIATEMGEAHLELLCNGMNTCASPSKMNVLIEHLI